MIILDIDKPERCGKCPMHHDGNDYCKLAHDHASFVRAKGCPIQTIKTGHWIEHPEIETSTPEYLMFYECSECGDRQCFCKSDIHKKRFCSNCGCRIVEPQESERKV